MNERLKQLMIQADYPAPEIALRAHKLAELIVRECASMTDNYVAMKVDGAMLGSLMLQTFGVQNEQG
jgi:hypothetical protein